MAGLVFACTERTGLLTIAGSPLETTSAGKFDPATSRVTVAPNDNVDLFQVTLDSDLTSARIGFSLFCSSNDGDSVNAWVRLRDSSNVGIFQIISDNSGAVRRCQYWDGSTYQTIGDEFSDGYLDERIRWDIVITTGTGGTVEVYKDGNLFRSGSIGNATNDVNNIIFGHTDNASGASYFSEIMIADNTLDLLGGRVETEAPTADGTDTDGTGTYADVDEAVTDSGSTEISLATGGDKNGFTSPARTFATGDDVIAGVSVAARMKREASGPQSARFYLLINATYYYSSTFALSTSYAPYQYVWTQNPDTAAAWTLSEAQVATLEWGVEAVT